MKFFKKRITESEFKKALSNCIKTARKSYARTIEYQQKVESVLRGLNISLGKKTFVLLDDKDTENFEFADVLKNVVKELKERSNAGLRDLIDAINIKSKYLKDFTITLFGRTKAGKSTIRESLTRNGDGSTIGLGKLHTTKEVGDYYWKGLRILDTPGVEGYGGEIEKSKAYEIIDQSDVIIFLTTDESQQPGEFHEMEKLIEINKPFFVILNIKDKLTEISYLERFFKYRGNLFNNEIIEEHKQRIFTETKLIGIHNINIIWISALASCISQFSERGFNSQYKEGFLKSLQHPQIQEITRLFLDNFNMQDSQRLWQLSKIDKVYEYIAYEINSRGRQRRVLTFYDSTINFIDTILKMLWEHQRSLRAQAIFMVKKRKELKNFFEKFISDSNLRIERKCEAIFQPIKEWIPNFIDNYLGEDNAQSVFKKRLDKEKMKIEKEMNGLIEEIVKELQVHLFEFSRQYQYDIGTIKLNPSEIGYFRKGQTGKILKWTGVSAGGVSAICFGIGALTTKFAVANIWNPAGWIAAGVSVALGGVSFLFSKHEEKKWIKEKKETKERLWDNIDKMERKTRGAYKTWFYENITKKGRKAMLEQVSFYIDGLFMIADTLKKYAQQLFEIEKQMNKELFIWLFQLEDIECSEKDILSIAREQGVSTKIMLPDSQHINVRIRTNLGKLCGEHILFFNDSDDVRERVARAIYPAKPSLEQIKITQVNEQTTAKITIPNKEEKGIYIGKNGVNIRLAQQVCGIKIELN